MTFKKGHPPYYVGGATVGHAPTSDGSHLPKGGNDLSAHQFGKPGGNKHGNNGRPATSKQRQCMEAVQNLDCYDAASQRKLELRFSPGMVRRLVALQAASESPECTHFLQAQRLIREILLVPNRKEEEDAKPAAEGSSIELLHGHVDAQLPGAANEEVAAKEGEIPAAAESVTVKITP